MYRILIAGAGSIGRRHLHNLRRLGANDLMLVRRNFEPLPEAPELPVFTDLTRALAASPDAVIVSNPTAHHLDVALPAARAGCHLFIEKPLSHSWDDDAAELLTVVREKRLTTLIGFDLRFDPGLRRAKELLDESRLGRVVSIQAQVGQYLPDWHPAEDYRKGVSARIETGGGVILDLIHELDYVSWLVGPVAQVSCFADHLSSLEIETEDAAAITLKFESGAIGTVCLDYVQRTASRTCRIIGEKGTMVWDYQGRSLRWFEADKGVWQEFEYRSYERNDRFLAEMRHFLACLRNEERPDIDAAAGAQVLKLALAAKQSAADGKICRVKS